MNLIESWMEVHITSMVEFLALFFGRQHVPTLWKLVILF
jgi:hypothetical protein